MARPRMHAGEVHTDTGLVHRLIAEQFPHWAELPMTPVRSFGTDHDIYRLGEHLAVRLPRIGWASEQPAKEARWLPRLAPKLPLAVPRPVALGRPGGGYPFPWAVHEWLPGTSADGTLHDLARAAVDLAGFVAALRGVDTTGAPTRRPGARGCPLAERDDDVRQAIGELGDRIPSAAALHSWEQSLAAPAWAGDEVWVHGDLLPGNLLVVEGRLSAVIDFGGLAVGDPACDLQPAWNLFDGESRRGFLTALRVDPAMRLRGRGWALSQAVIALPYYWETNPGIVRQALHAVDLVLSEDDEWAPVAERSPSNDDGGPRPRNAVEALGSCGQNSQCVAFCPT
jgi:aminoglycoside phosphotransferase (APT) family kinase protein